jgi:ABC-type microcin C transport system permease subunit YejE
VLLGLIAGYFRGWVDTLIMRVMDIILAFPSLLLALVLVAVLGPGLLNAMIAISIVNAAALRSPDARRRHERARRGICRRFPRRRRRHICA